MFSKKKPYTDKEVQIKHIIENICQKEDTEIRIDPSNLNMFITNEEKHYDIVLLPNSIIITNSKFSLRETFSDNFIDDLKLIVTNRASQDRKKVLEEILSRETTMLLEIENSLKGEETINN